MIKQFSFFGLLIMLLLAACGPTTRKQEAAPVTNSGSGPVVEIFLSPT